MTDLILCIASTTLLFVIFKYFSHFKVENLQAIIVNYVVAGALGTWLSGPDDGVAGLVAKPWFVSGAALGMCFIVTFSLIALSAQRVGVGITSVANKMSLVIPVLSGVVFLGEHLDGVKVLGVMMAVASVILTIWPQKEPTFDTKDLYLPVLIFFGSGSIDAVLNYMRESRVGEEDFAMFTALLFFASAAMGLLVYLYRRMRHGLRFNRTSVIAGVALGIPNYFSIYFLLRALNHPTLESTVVFPVVNTGIVLLSTVLALVLFNERPSRINMVGIAMAATAIVLMSV